MLQELKTNSPWGLASLVMLFITLLILVIVAAVAGTAVNEVGMLSALMFVLSVIAIIALVPLAVFVSLGIVFALVSIFLKKEKKAPALISLTGFSVLLVIFLATLLTAK